MKTEIALEFDGISFAYRKRRPVLRNLHLAVPRGSLCALLGANGSGKTTVLKLAAGLLRPQAGAVRLEGRDVSKMDQTTRCRRIGFVFQNPDDQLFGLTVEDDVASGPRNLGLTGDEIAERTREALAMVGATHLLGRSVGDLSFGEQRRAALAGVLAMQPEVLLLDEVTAGLDPRGERDILQLLVSLGRRRGMTIVLATHAIDPIPEIADLVAVLYDGRFQSVGPPDRVFERTDELERAGLRPPYLAQCFGRFYRENQIEGRVPMTVDEGVCELRSLFADGLAAEEARVGKSESECCGDEP